MAHLVVGRDKYMTGSALKLPQGSSFPSSGNEEGDLFWRTDESRLYIYDESTAAFVAVDPGGKVEEYVHTQSSSSAAWSIQHDLNTLEVVVEVYDSLNPRNEIVLDDIDITDSDNIIVNFTSAVTGVAVVRGVPTVSPLQQSLGVFRGGNHILNFPMVTGQEAALPEWWDEDGDGDGFGTGDITLTYVQDLLGTESVPDTVFPEGFKAVSGAAGGTAGDYVYQEIVLADHDLLHIGDVISASVWVYQATTADTITFSIFESTDGFVANKTTLGSATTQAVDGWTQLKLQGLEISASVTHLRFALSTGSNTDTFYFTLPMLHLGRVARAWEENPIRRIENRTSQLFSFNPTVDLGFTDVDLSADSHPLAYALDVVVSSTGAAGVASDIRIVPSYAVGTNTGSYLQQSIASLIVRNTKTVGCGDDQGVRITCNDASQVSNIAGGLAGYWRWIY